MKTQNPEVKKIAKLAFPEYKGRKYSVEVTEKPVQLSDYWDGGSRNYVMAVQIESGEVYPPSVIAQNPYNSGAHLSVIVPDGWVLVQHSIYCGKDVGLTVFVNPRNVTPALTA